MSTELDPREIKRRKREQAKSSRSTDSSAPEGELLSVSLREAEAAIAQSRREVAHLTNAPLSGNAHKRKREVDDDDDDDEGGDVDMTDASGTTRADEFVSESTKQAMELQAQLQRDVESRRLAATMTVPTNDFIVRLRLRELGQPIALFGEDAAERRDRLREVIIGKSGEGEDVSSQLTQEQIMHFSVHGFEGLVAHGDPVTRRLKKKGGFPGASASLRADVEREMRARALDRVAHSQAFATEGSQELAHARAALREVTAKRAKARLEAQRREREALSSKEDADKDAKMSDADMSDAALENARDCFRKLQRLKQFTGTASQAAGARPVSWCSFAPNSRYLATADWGGDCRVWSIPDGAHVATMPGHTNRALHVQFNPAGTQLASASADATAKLWAFDATGKHDPDAEHETCEAVGTLRGHEARLARLAYVPDGRHLVTTSYDFTWRLWDVERCAELLMQDGHSSETYACAVHPDGSLVATGDLGGVGRLWDLRTGLPVWALKGHVKGILDMDWSPNGFHLATASADHSVRIWDVRKQGMVYNIPAHSHSVSSVKFDRTDGQVLMTAGFDATVRLWSAWTFKNVAVLRGHEGCVLGADLSPDAKYVASSAYNKVWKLWECETALET